MRFNHFRDVLRVPGVATLLVVAIFARMPLAAAPLVLTLHVTQTMGLSFYDAGIVAMAATIGAAISGPWRGHLIDKFGLRRAVWPSILVEIAYWGSVPHLPYWGLVVASFVGGAFALPIFSILRQALATMVAADKRRAAYSLDSICTELTFMMGPALFGTIAAVVSTVLAAYLVGGSIVIAGIVLLFMNPPTRTPDVEGVESEISDGGPVLPVAMSAREFVSSWRGIAILLATACATFILTGTDIAIIAFHREHDIMSLVSVSIVFWCLGSLIGGVVYGSMHRPISPFVLLLLLGVVTVPGAFATNLVVLCSLVFVAGLFCAPMVTSSSEAIAGMVAEKSRGQALGWQGTAFTVGSGVASPVVGRVIDLHTFTGGFIMAGAIGVAIAGLGLLTMRVNRTRNAMARDI